MSDESPVCYRFGSFEFNADEKELRHKGTVLPLTAKAIDLLLVLVTHAGQTKSKSDLMRALWPNTAVDEGSLSQTVFLLRKALGEDPEGSNYILTIPKRGYKFVAPVHTTLRSAIVRPEGARTCGTWIGIIVAVVVVGVAGWVVDRRWRCRCVNCRGSR